MRDHPDGEWIDAARPRLRTVTIPIAVDAAFAAGPTTRELLRSLAAALDPTKGTGRLIVANGDDERELLCRYVEGLELDDANATPDLTDYRGAIKLLGGPYWQQTADESTTYSTGSPVSFFPLLPIRLAASEVFATETITNLGDVEAWPVWELTGPGDGFVLRNVTTGRAISWAGTLGAGETLTIDTRPRAQSTTPKTVIDGAGTNRFADLDAWDFWPLIRGAQTIQLEVVAATAATRITCRHRPQFWTV